MQAQRISDLLAAAAAQQEAAQGKEAELKDACERSEGLQVCSLSYIWQSSHTPPPMMIWQSAGPNEPSLPLQAALNTDSWIPENEMLDKNLQNNFREPQAKEEVAAFMHPSRVAFHCRLLKCTSTLTVGLQGSLLPSLLYL